VLRADCTPGKGGSQLIVSTSRNHLAEDWKWFGVSDERHGKSAAQKRAAAWEAGNTPWCGSKPGSGRDL